MCLQQYLSLPLPAEDYTTLTTPLMEAMVLIGLSFGPFVKGWSQKLTMDTFIKYVSVLEPVVNNRRVALHSSTRLFLKQQRVELFSFWEVERSVFGIL